MVCLFCFVVVVVAVVLFVCFNPVCLFIIISLNAYDVALMLLLRVVFKSVSFSS